MSASQAIPAGILTEQILSDTREILSNSRSPEGSVGACLREKVRGLTSSIVKLLKGQEHYVVLDEPSEYAMQGAISLTGEKGRAIRRTRPSDELVREFQKVVDLAGLEDIWQPPSLMVWSFGIIRRYITRHDHGPISPDVLLSLGRLGEAQLAGASEEVMRVVLEDLKMGRYRTCKQWREIMIGGRIIQESYTRDFIGDLVRFTVPELGDDEEFILHELEFPLHAKMALKHAHEQMDSLTDWEVRKIHYQAFDEKVNCQNLEQGDTACPICLMEFENGQIGKGKKKSTTLYDIMKDNRQPIKLTCGHVFGTTCIEKWLSNNNSCPLCRATILGRGRKLKIISEQALSKIKTFDEGRAMLYYEDLEIDLESHIEIAKAVERGHMSAWHSLKWQFQCLKDIDSRLGTSMRNIKDHSKATSYNARWMDIHWDAFATNVLALGDFVKDYMSLNPKSKLDSLATDIKTNLAKMLDAYSQRSRL